MAKGTLSFFVPDAAAYRTVRISGSRVIEDAAGLPIASFPRNEEEVYSWYVCRCEAVPVAVRARVAAELKCPRCDVRPAKAALCDCGVASDLDGEKAECPWCLAQQFEPFHRCPQAPQIDLVAYRGAVCPLCDQTAEPEDPEPQSLPDEGPAPVAPAHPPLEVAAAVEERSTVTGVAEEREAVLSGSVPGRTKLAFGLAALATVFLVGLIAVARRPEPPGEGRSGSPGAVVRYGDLQVELTATGSVSLDGFHRPEGKNRGRSHRFSRIEARSWTLRVWNPTDPSQWTEQHITVEPDATTTLDVDVGWR